MTTFTATTVSRSVGGTQRLAAALAALLAPGDVVCLYGELGAGKTYFTKGLVAGLGGDGADVTSPTFVLMQSYAARLTVYHFDAYRLRSAQDLVDIGSDDFFGGDGVSVVEWADRVADALPPERIEVHLATTGPTERQLRFLGVGVRAAERVRRLADDGLLVAAGSAERG